VIWRLTSAPWSSGFGIPISLPKSRSARPCSLPRLQETSDSSDFVQFLGEQIKWAEAADFLLVTLNTRLKRSADVNQVRKKAAQRLGVLGPLLNRRRILSVRNGVLLHKQLVRSMTYYACPMWRAAASSHVRKLQVLQFTCY
jgi:hypothetical protein